MKKKILENGYLIIAELIFLLKFQDHKNGERLIDLNFFTSLRHSRFGHAVKRTQNENKNEATKQNLDKDIQKFSKKTSI